MSSPQPIYVRKKKRRRRAGLRWCYWIPALAIAAVGAWLLVRAPRRSGPQPLAGYISSAETLQQEYGRFYGKRLTNAELPQQFRQAAGLMLQAQYAAAAAILETVAREASLPVVYNDLGVLYAGVGDRARTVNAFREALARDLTYQPVRLNLNRLRGFTADSANPVTQEIEPNNSLLLANVAALETPMEAAIGQDDDVDTFRFAAPPAPRDILLLEISAKGGTLAPVLKFYDGEMRFLDWGAAARQPGDMNLRFSPEPNAGLYVQVRGYGASSGPYVLRVRALRLFDSFEPNDDILSTRRIAVNQKIEANIMDARDTDYYSFFSPVGGAVTIELQNRSATLIPALSTFTPDLRAAGFGPDVRTPGAGFEYKMEVLAGQVYPIQIWSLGNTAGEYSLIVKQ